ncbi:M14 family metallopeptidase [Roseateles oligotrophus]|uniref:Succinylglutamate desuccinylase/aspartoacylase family protein n=1 Tax=Roseateles oligotrophus TaxID=1769250 RepID=A0ABT2YHW0_9BURK|nr:succinylglutamate desuccinylase/aspartoacylase family protein [Roseateles oligotrophus]MCV2369647.1 succinylglutamate desuccinylase/aspartoacylase family protein [Roseateles oligotrophus]
MRPLAKDGRPTVAELLAAYERLVEAGWTRHQIAEQALDSGAPLPIHAYASGAKAKTVLIAGIHGREPAGAIALAEHVDRLIAHASTRPILLLPLLNPWGYQQHQRYGPAGQSVSDSEHWLGRSEAAICPEAKAITAWLMERADLAPAAAVLDLHEDPVYEAPDYRFEAQGSYFYVAGPGAATHPITQRVAAYLQRCPLPLVMQGETRFGESLDGGMIVDSADGSIDELLARKRGCTPVITTELLLNAESNPLLSTRVAVYLGLLEAFFGA